MSTLAVQTLQQYFGFSQFRSGQAEIVAAILTGKPVLAILPTGGGKSLCFQVPALIFPGVTIVISPLISLMKDQVDHLLAKGIAATYIASNVSQIEQRQRLASLVQGKIKLCYVSPEKLQQDSFIYVCQQLFISMIVVDEAHCISLWGSKFRPSYQKIPEFIKKIKQKNKKIVIAAFTATATPSVVAEIQRYLPFRHPQLFQHGFLRQNLFWHNILCQSTWNKNLLLFKLLKQHPAVPTIIYCSTRIACEQVHDLITSYDFTKQWKCGVYHGGLSQQERENQQNSFLKDETQIMIATNAFGMGVDKSNIRVVIHYQLPAHLENYYQEAGRAGRDGATGHSYLLYQDQDLLIQQQMIMNTYPDQTHPRYQVELEKLQQIQQYAQSSSCLEQHIANYFGDTHHKGYCQNCHHCLQQCITLTQAEQTVVQQLEMINQTYARKRQLHEPPVLFTIKQIEAIAVLEPKTLADLQKIPGVGSAIIDAYAHSRLSQRISTNC